MQLYMYNNVMNNSYFYYFVDYLQVNHFVFRSMQCLGVLNFSYANLKLGPLFIN